ncbi:putative mitochondrion protein [Acaromyces ingoldii]|uniref:Putative mitochondrion protein n=1 Tax=Acaromyces ingoldii TaxID=215250 RepID=A0A316YC66_9BASI|nr:putative mitochondrion protein [Acaromyces ingoldii]PWN86829.1 putative mitochondrion protein [Acaromyces ingoldii]
MTTYARLVRFVPASAPSSQPLIGEPCDELLDVGLAAHGSQPIEVEVFSGSSILQPGHRTGKKEHVKTLLSPLAAVEVGTIRCIGLNYLSHAKEMNLAIPPAPILFMKPSTSLGDPWPAKTVIPKATAADNAADYESEVAIVLGKTCKDVSEAEAMDRFLGITASNDVSSRVVQFAQSQWCFSKSFDGACPIGPAFVHKSQIKDLGEVRITGSLNGKVVQTGKLDDLIFSIPKIISFLSQGTTLPAGTLILTGTPVGVGWSRQPRLVLGDGDEFRVRVSHSVGTLINSVAVEH